MLQQLASYFNFCVHYSFIILISHLWFFPIGMYGYDSWIIKKAEHQSIDAFELWCWRRFSRAPWTARRSKQSILQEIKAEYSLEGLIFKLKLQYFGHLMCRAVSFEMTLMLGKIESRRRRRGQRTEGDRWLDGITESKDLNFSKPRDLVMNREAWHSAVHGTVVPQAQPACNKHLDQGSPG